METVETSVNSSADSSSGKSERSIFEMRGGSHSAISTRNFVLPFGTAPRETSGCMAPIAVPLRNAIHSKRPRPVAIATHTGRFKFRLRYTDFTRLERTVLCTATWKGSPIVALWRKETKIRAYLLPSPLEGAARRTIKVKNPQIRPPATITPSQTRPEGSTRGHGAPHGRR